jgi:hypothetical protein
MALYELHDRPDLDAPVALMVLEGWIDAGQAATTAVQTLLSELDTYPIATYDADQLLDHRARRPVMHLVNGVNTGLSWPGIELRGGTDLDGNDLLLLVGAEPDHAWRGFVDETLDLLEVFGTRMLAGFGAYPATVPHTRPVVLSVTSSTEALAVSSGLLRGSLDVPAGAQAAVEYFAGERDLPALGLWAQVPHYVSGEPTPYPAAALALIEHTNRVTGLRLPTGDLAADAARTRNRIDTAMSSNDDHVQMLRMLEERHDQFVAESTHDDLPTTPLPTADELADEVEAFLREQEK